MRLQWKDNLTPVSEDFQDIYFAEESGFEEAKYVFLNQNQIAERFERDHKICVGEIGFGTGLNFFATWQLWIRSRRKPSTRLEYFSFEKFLLAPDQIRRALSPWKELEPFVEKFLKRYELLPPGLHRIHFGEDSLTLTLAVGDASALLKQTNFYADAWYFDGFAPRKNPELWSEGMMKAIAERSLENATISTFTAAGFVRRGLQSAGFEMERFPGFGRKKEMLRGRIRCGKPKVELSSRRIGVIGAGVAGTSLCRSLSARGHEVHVFEKNESAWTEASNQPAAIQFPALSPFESPSSRLTWEALYFLRLNLLTPKPTSGLLVLYWEGSEMADRWMRAFTKLPWISSFVHFLDANDASEAAGMRLCRPGFFVPTAGAVIPKDFQARLLDETFYETRHSKFYGNHKLVRMEKSNHWTLHFENGSTFEGDDLVLANSFSAGKFLNLPLRKTQGQIALIRSPIYSSLKVPLCFDGYLTPALKDGSQVLGSTYAETEDESEEHIHSNREDLLRRLGGVFDRPTVSFDAVEVVADRIAYRATRPGSAPYCGRASNGAYLLSSLGSRGLLTAPLLAESLACELSGDPSPIEADLANEFRPPSSTS